MIRFDQCTRREYYKAQDVKDAKSPSYHRLYENLSELQKIFLIRVFLFKYISPIIFKIGILECHCRKTVFHSKGYTTVIMISLFAHRIVF